MVAIACSNQPSFNPIVCSCLVSSSIPTSKNDNCVAVHIWTDAWMDTMTLADPFQRNYWVSCRDRSGHDVSCAWHVMPWNVVACHGLAYHVMTHHGMAPHDVSCHDMISHDMLWQGMSSNVMPWHDFNTVHGMTYPIMSWHDIWCHVIPWYFVLRHGMTC